MAENPRDTMRGVVSRVGGNLVERFEARTSVRLPAILFVDRTSADACILDISSRGLMLQTDHPLRVGHIIELRHGAQSLVGSVKWTRGRRAGIRLGGRIAVQVFLRGEADFALVPLAPPHQRRHGVWGVSGAVDWMVQHFQWLVLAAFVAGGAILAAQTVSKVLDPLGSIRLG